MKVTLACSLVFLAASGAVFSQRQTVTSLAAERPPIPLSAPASGASPEMARLAKALTGEWETVETMERSDLFPSGGSRHGIVRVRLAAGGTSLIYEVYSDGSAGKLDGFLLIWWDKGVGLYQFFACFNDPDHPCRTRGTGRWESGAFVNEYEATVGGKKTRWRDTFVITPRSHTLVAAMDVGKGNMKTFITTRATRR